MTHFGTRHRDDLLFSSEEIGEWLDLIAAAPAHDLARHRARLDAAVRIGAVTERQRTQVVKAITERAAQGNVERMRCA